MGPTKSTKPKWPLTCCFRKLLEVLSNTPPLPFFRALGVSVPYRGGVGMIQRGSRVLPDPHRLRISETKHGNWTSHTWKLHFKISHPTVVGKPAQRSLSLCIHTERLHPTSSLPPVMCSRTHRRNGQKTDSPPWVSPQGDSHGVRESSHPLP